MEYLSDRVVQVTLYLKSPGLMRTYSGANDPGVLNWYRDADCCARHWGEVVTVCSVCFRVCSLNRPDTTISRFVKWLIHKISELNRLFV